MDGRHIWKDSGGVRTYFLYDGDHLLAEFRYNTTTAQNELVADYTWGPSGLLERYTPAGGSISYLYDDHGNVVHRLDDANTLVTNSYDAWGNLVYGASGDDPVGYGGQYGYYTDHETGFILCTHRYYDPLGGRWLTQDPSGYQGGMNLYGYCGNDPVSGADPSGLRNILDDASDVLNRINPFGGSPISGGASLQQSAHEFDGEYRYYAARDNPWAAIGDRLISLPADMLEPFAVAEARSPGEAMQRLGNCVMLALLIEDIGRCGTNCFIAGTKVATPDGKKVIEQIKENDLVWGYDFAGIDTNVHFVTENQGITFSILPFTPEDIARPVNGSVQRPQETDFVGVLDSSLVLQHGQRLSTVAPGTIICYQGKVYIVLKSPWPGLLALVDTGNVLRHVVRTFVNTTYNLTDLGVIGNNGISTTISGTPGHKFYVPELDTYVSMSGLKVGTVLQTPEGSATVMVNTTRQVESLVYNFEVEGIHNYYVASAQVLVHNWNCGDLEWLEYQKGYWKQRAEEAPELYTEMQLKRMRIGKAPLHPVYGVPKELHHLLSRSNGGANDPLNLIEVWPWEHDSIDPFRYYSGPKPDGW